MRLASSRPIAVVATLVPVRSSWQILPPSDEVRQQYVAKEYQAVMTGRGWLTVADIAKVTGKHADGVAQRLRRLHRAGDIERSRMDKRVVWRFA